MSLFGKGVIFDLDGVLVDTDVCHFHSWKQIAEELGIPFSEEDNHHMRGVSRKESLMLMTHGKIELDNERIQEILLKKNDVYKRMIEEKGEKLIVRGAPEFVLALRRLGCATALSSCSKNVSKIMEVSGLDAKLFDAVVDGDMIAKCKPDPEIFLKAAELMGAPPARCVVFEDAQSGVEAAKRAGMKAFGVGPAPLEGCVATRKRISEYSVVDVESVLANA